LYPFDLHFGYLLSKMKSQLLIAGFMGALALASPAPTLKDKFSKDCEYKLCKPVRCGGSDYVCVLHTLYVLYASCTDSG
jgi:hypothetical protein